MKFWLAVVLMMSCLSYSGTVMADEIPEEPEEDSSDDSGCSTAVGTGSIALALITMTVLSRRRDDER